jgi:hypothetical protein
MSIALIPPSELASEDWQLADDGAAKPTALVVQLRRQAFVLPYFRFIFAEGNNSVVRIAFASHMVNVSGEGLAALLPAFASQSVIRIIQPTDTEANFGIRGSDSARIEGPCILDITVEEFK